MRQTSVFRISHGSKLLLCVLLLLFSCISGVLYAQEGTTGKIEGLTLQVQGDTKINAGGHITVTATWQSDSPPYFVTYSAGGSPIKSDATNNTNSTMQLSAAEIGEGTNKGISVSVQSVTDTQSAQGNQTVTVILRAPTINGLQVLTPEPIGPNDLITVQFTTDTNVTVNSVRCENVEGTAVGNQTGTSFQYSLQLQNFTDGQHTITVNVTDDTLPTESANKGTATTQFKVGTGATGGTTIEEANTTPSPTNSTTITLSGNAPNGVAKIAILDKGTEVTRQNIAGSPWTITLTEADGNAANEGDHSYVAVAYDAVEMEISRSSAYNLTVDRTAFSGITPKTEDLPDQTNLDNIDVYVDVSTEIQNEKTKPVIIQAFVNGVAKEGATATTSQNGTVKVSVPLTNGQNTITLRTTDGAGNVSEDVPVKTITMQNTAATYVTSVVVEGIGVPFNTNGGENTAKMIGTGTHPIVIHFNNSTISQTATPTIEIDVGGSRMTASGSWQPGGTNFVIYNASFKVPGNLLGSAQLTISNVKDTFGNVLEPYVQADAFGVDSMPPVSSITNPEPIYITVTASNAVLITGNVSDDFNGVTGSGIESLDLIIKDSSNNAVGEPTNIPLSLSTPSPWNKTVNFSGQGDGAITLDEGQYKLFTQAKDKAISEPNVEDISTKTGVSLIMDVTPPESVRISLGNSGVDLSSSSVQIVASDVTRIVAVASDNLSGLDLSSPNYSLTLTGPSGNEISGEKSNNGVDTLFFDFPALTEKGEYVIKFAPVDKAGNVIAEVASRTFNFNKSALNDVVIDPPHGSITNHSNENLAVSQIKISVPETNSIQPDYQTSTVSVKYNGQEVGNKTLTALTTDTSTNTGTDTSTETTTDCMYATLHGTAADSLKSDGSHDGTYYVSVILHAGNGSTGETVNKSFVYDNLPPVIVDSNVGIKEDEVWIGTGTSEIKVTLSDAPKDILDNYSWQYPSTFTPQMPIDTTWYSGPGSGINSESSISWWVDTNVASITTGSVNGNVLSVRVPTQSDLQTTETSTSTSTSTSTDTSTSTSTSGVATITLQIVTMDKVNNGADDEYPNKNIILKVLKYDYTPPTLVIASETNNKIYCKNVVKIKGTASDSGVGARVEYIESSEDGTNWASVQPFTPSANGTFEMTLDITNKPDGKYTVQFRAKDRGGNVSEVKTFTYTVDRTPPDPPELTIPLGDYTVNKRNQSFKWVSVASATAYDLQISDDSSFSNVVNTQTSSDYSGVKGTVYTTTDGSFSLPKDGTFYWRVASLEKCFDGYNISDFSETRKLIIDTVKPYILSVTPSPSSSNKVSTGMVTFTIRFSETLDSTIDFSATLTSAGGQLMKIEKVSCTGDTWTGTTVIPKNNSALYDGTAIIAVEGAADLAGNLMAADSSHTIVVNTGPAFTTKLFSNPANEYEITIITKSSESLQTAPSVYVKQNSVKTTVTMNFLKDKFYSGSYKIDKENPGSAYINISGTDLYGMVGNSTVEFVIADVNASARLSISSSSGKATLKAAEGSTYSPTSVYLISRDMLESPFASASALTNASIRSSAGIRASTNTSSNSELIGILGLDEICPSSTKLKKCMLYTADVNGEVIDPSKMDKIHIYRQDSKGNWVFQGGELKDYKISAQITGLGRLALMADMTAPRASSFSPSNNTKLDTNYPEIKGEFVDNGSGLVVDSFKLYIDDLQVKNVEMNKDGTFSYQVKQGLKKGKHEIKYEVSDKAGNNLIRAVTVDAPALLNIGEFSPYPNPARGNRISFAYNFGVIPEAASLKVYDTAGHIVKKFGSEDFDRIQGLIRWDLTNQKGKRIANGTYIYRLEVTANGQKIKKRGKFAVLR